MNENLRDEEAEYERHRDELNESVDGGGCTETWEALSEKRATEGTGTAEAELDVEETLVRTDCLRLAEDGTDFEFVDSFRRAWRNAIEALDGENPGKIIEDMFSVDGTVAIEEAETAVRARADGQLLAQWVSRPAMVADLAACRVLSDRDDAWAERSPVARSRLAGGVRLFLESCPDCDGRASFDTETKTSCCSEFEVATISCVDCGVTLLEIPVSSEEA